MVKKVEDFPQAFLRALETVHARGELVVAFATEEECYAERLRFYKFLAAVRADRGHALYDTACACVLQWRAISGSKVKRVLKIVRADTRAAAWGEAIAPDANADVVKQLEIDEAMARVKAEMKEKFGA
jgi:hypothetical protein